MEQNKYLNESKYQENETKLKRTGKILLIVGICVFILGIVLLVLGFIGFGKTGISAASDMGIVPSQTAKGVLGGFGLFALGGFLIVIGFGIIGSSSMIMVFANRRNIMAFTAQQTIPVTKEAINEMSPTIGNAAGEIAKGIKKGLNEANKEEK